jgi:hypothetical protein
MDLQAFSKAVKHDITSLSPCCHKRYIARNGFQSRRLNK